MRRIHDRNDRITEGLHLGNVVVWPWLKGHGNVALFLHERRQRFDTSGNPDFVGDPWIIAPELFHGAIQKTRNGRLDADGLHKSTAQMLEIIDLRLQTIEVPHRRVHLPHEYLAGCRQA